MSPGTFGPIAVWTLTLSAIVGCAVSEPLDLNAAGAHSDGNQTTVDGSAAATGGNRASLQSSGGAAGTSAGIGSAGTDGVGGREAGGSSGSTGSAGTQGRGAGSGASGQSGGSGQTGVAGTTGGGGGAGGAGGRSSAPTFTEIYKTILVGYCGGSSCHNPGSQQGVGFSTQSGAYKSLVSVAVIPGDSQGSTFYTLVATGAMPDGKPMLSSAFIGEIGAWIDAGALNN